MFDESVRAHRALPDDEVEMLRDHLAAHPTGLPAEPWRLATTPELRALQAWAEELGMFGREALFRGADAAVTLLEAAWSEGERAHPGDELLAALASGSVVHPSVHASAARAWLVAPSERAALAADATLPTGEQLELDEVEFDGLRGRPFVWLLMAARDLVAITNHPKPEHFTGRVAVAAAAGVSLGRGIDGPARVRHHVRTVLGAWVGARRGND